MQKTVSQWLLGALFVVGVDQMTWADDVKVAPSFEQGFAFDGTTRKFLASSTITAIQAWPVGAGYVLSLKVGTLYDAETTLYGGGISVDVKNLVNKMGGLMTYSLPWDVELGYMPTVDINTWKVHHSVTATLVKIKF